MAKLISCLEHYLPNVTQCLSSPQIQYIHDLNVQNQNLKHNLTDLHQQNIQQTSNITALHRENTNLQNEVEALRRNVTQLSGTMTLTLNLVAEMTHVESGSLECGDSTTWTGHDRLGTAALTGTGLHDFEHFDYPHVYTNVTQRFSRQYK